MRDWPAGLLTPKSPNPWGLYDMYGNVQEWCLDWHGNYNDLGHVLIDPQQLIPSKYCIVRGGAYALPAECTPTAHRSLCDVDSREDYIGFRLVWAAQ